MRLLFPLILCANLWAQNASIQGTVINVTDQQPLPGVHVRLVNVQMNSMTVYGAVSDRAGHFSMASVPPGAYVPSPELRGFVPSPQKDARIPIPTNVEVKAGQQITDLKIEMVRHAVLAGRVLDDAGDPVPYVAVQITNEKGELIPLRLFGSSQAMTNELGEFRMVGPPGKYFIKATPNRNATSQLTDIRTDGSSAPAYSATFFPNAASAERASMVEISAGEDKHNLDIRLNRQQSLTVSGMVTGIPPHSGLPMVYLQFADDSKTFYSRSSLLADAEGRFSFAKLQAGTYRLMASVSSPARLVSQVQETRLDRSDATNIELALTGGVELNGTLEFPGDATPTRRAIRLSPAGSQFTGVSAPSPVVTDDRGGFHFAGIPPHSFTVNVEPMPDDAYIKSVVLDGADIKGPLDLAHGRIFTLKVVAGRGAGVIKGTLRDSQGQVIVGHAMLVFLTPDPKTIKRENMINVKPDGTYEIKGVRPGKYRLFAIDALKQVNITGIEGFQPFAEKVAEIEIKEGASLSQDLTPLEKETAK